MIADLNSGPPEIIGTDPSEGGGGRLLPSLFCPLQDFWYSGGPGNGDKNHLLRKKRDY